MSCSVTVKKVCGILRANHVISVITCDQCREYHFSDSYLYSIFGKEIQKKGGGLTEWPSWLHMVCWIRHTAHTSNQHCIKRLCKSLRNSYTSRNTRCRIKHYNRPDWIWRHRQQMSACIRWRSDDAILLCRTCVLVPNKPSSHWLNVECVVPNKPSSHWLYVVCFEPIRRIMTFHFTSELSSKN